ncbi:TolC family protein [Nitrospirota bacterium]
MIFKRALICFSLMTLLSAPAWGISLEDAQNEALRNSESAHIGQYRTEAMRQSARQSSASVKPQVRFSGNALKMGTNAEDNPLIPYPETEISATIEGSQLLWAGGRLYKSLHLERTIKTQSTLLGAIYKRDIRTQVRNAYYGAMLRASLLHILEDRVLQRQRELRDASDLRAAGMVTSLDVRQARLNLNLSEDALLEGQNDYRDSLVELTLVMGRDVDTGTFPEPDGELQRAADLISKVGLLHKAVENQEVLTLRQANAQMQAAELSYGIARTGRIPELSLIGTATSSGEDTSEMSEQWAAGLRLSIPIFDGGLISSSKAKAHAEYSAAKEQLSQIRKSLLAEAVRLNIKAHSMEERISLKEENMWLAEQNYEDARGQYREGMITLTNLEAFNLAYAETRFQLMRQYWEQQGLMTRILALLE